MAKFAAGKKVEVVLPLSVGPPLSNYRGKTGIVMGTRHTDEGRMYKVSLILPGATFEEPVFIELKEEWLQKGGIVAESQNVNFVTVREVLSAKEVTYKVPTFQRRYCWAPFQWKQFWDSVTKVRDDSTLNNHSLERLMLLEQKDSTRLILDGQQRTTTTQLLLFALCDRLESFEKSSAEKYRYYCREGLLTPTMYDRPDFKRCLTERLPDGDSSMVNAKRFFSGFCDSLPDVASCVRTLDALLDRLSLTAFVVTDENKMQAVYAKMAQKQELANAAAKVLDIFSCVDCYSEGDGGKETKSTHWGPEGERLCLECAAKKPGSVPMTPGIPMSPLDLVRNFIFDHYGGDDAMKAAFEKFWGPIETKGGSNTNTIEQSLIDFLEEQDCAVDNLWGIMVAFKEWWGTPPDGTSADAHADNKLKELLDGIQPPESSGYPTT